VVDEQARSDQRAGVDLDAGEEPCELLHRARDKGNALSAHPVREPVEQERMEPGISQGNLKPARRGRIHGERRVKVFPYFSKGLTHIFHFGLRISDCG
jgi:hypothetical protein